ncbi:ribosome maturation factor RimM [Galactobacter caseinivorans]|uniref:Ribosome maturation factor RimM n=1 Tax=Galactobacter caseinivorans TaxID=2676123 RepID=A0A496PGW0_9MICC|nr:ribosome maturation factor RimM [Galactobacter caseinivorans]RKW69709.1 ribosome maturation factor RimM [Galactobacter caseinivorans]
MKLQVARVGKPHGIRGELTVQLFTDDPEARFAPGAVLETEPATAGPLTVTSARWNKQILVVGFSEVRDRNRAEELRGTTLFVETSEEEVEDDSEGWYEHDLQALKAKVDGETIGEVTALITGTAQDLLVITRTDGAEVLVPFVEEIVPEVDVEAGHIILTPPPGLLDLSDAATETGTDSETQA